MSVGGGGIHLYHSVIKHMSNEIFSVRRRIVR